MNVIVCGLYSFFEYTGLLNAKLSVRTAQDLMFKLQTAEHKLYTIPGVPAWNFLDEFPEWSSSGYHGYERPVHLLLVLTGNRIDKLEYSVLQKFSYQRQPQNILVLGRQNYCMLAPGEIECSRHYKKHSQCVYRNTYIRRCIQLRSMSD